MTDRYDTSGNPEEEYYPDTSVLIKLEDIRDPEELLKRETELQLAAYLEVFSSFDGDLTSDLPYFYYLHYLIFGRLFAWDGRAIRFYLDVLSANARGDIFDWTLAGEDEYLRACVAGFAQDYAPMIAVLKRCAV